MGQELPFWCAAPTVAQASHADVFFTERMFCYNSRMPRMKSFTARDLVDSALQQFWWHGYCATSMEDLVAATGVSRHGIYTEFGGKRVLYLACFEHYQDTIFSPAISGMETPESTLSDVRAYFEYQIAAAERVGLPGPGCFVANSVTETAPHDPEVHQCVVRHNTRLKTAFANALRNMTMPGVSVNAPLIGSRAEALLVFSTGLWALSRLAEDARQLRSSADAFLDLVEGRR